MITKILWILLSLTMVVKAEQPLFVSLATELSDIPPENRQEWLHPVIFEPQIRYNSLIPRIKLLLFRFCTFCKWV